MLFHFRHLRVRRWRKTYDWEQASIYSDCATTCTSSWSCCCMACDGGGIKHLSQNVLHFFSSFFFAPFAHSCGDRRKEIIFSNCWKKKRKKKWRKKMRKKWWQFQTLNDVWYACDKKKMRYIQMGGILCAVLTHALHTIFHRLMFRLVEKMAHWRWCVVPIF